MLGIVDENYKFDNGCIYKIVYMVNMDDKNIYYLINVDDITDIKFCYLEGADEYIEIRDIEEFKKVISRVRRDFALIYK